MKYKKKQISLHSYTLIFILLQFFFNNFYIEHFPWGV